MSSYHTIDLFRPVRLQHILGEQWIYKVNFCPVKTRQTFIDSFKDKGDMRTIEFVLQQHIVKRTMYTGRYG